MLRTTSRALAVAGLVGTVALAAPSSASAGTLDTACSVLLRRPAGAATASTSFVVDDESGRWSGGYAWGSPPSSRVEALGCAFHDANGNGRQDVRSEPSTHVRARYTTGEQGATPWRETLTYPAGLQAGDRVCDRFALVTRSRTTGAVDVATGSTRCAPLQRQYQGRPV